MKKIKNILIAVSFFAILIFSRAQAVEDIVTVNVNTPSTTPTITTTAVSSITQTSAVSGGNITSDGGSVVTARGIVWNTSSNPTIALSTKTTNGSGTGSFSSNIINLSQNTTYYVRAYATNSNGTAYGNQISFTTLPVAGNSIPTVTSPTLSDITQTSATLGANLTSLGVPESVSDKGTCIGTYPAPTTNCLMLPGGNLGTFSHSRTGLICGTSYYFRGYAKNITGTAYSSDGTFTTSACPNLPDLIASDITPTTATRGVSTSFSSTITNQGTLTTSWSFYSFFQVATSVNGGGTITDLPKIVIPIINAGGSSVANTNYTFENTGSYSMRVCADKEDNNTTTSTDAVNESNEDNNCGNWTTITVSDPITYTLSVSKDSTNTGTGVITSSPSGINCGLDCSEVYNQNTSVVLTATPDTGSIFSGWTGACTNTSGTCTVSMSSSKSVGAKFTAITISDFTVTTPIVSNPSTAITFNYTKPTTTTGSVECRLLNYNKTIALSGFTINSSITLAGINAPSSTTNNPYGYYIECRNSTYTSIKKDNQVLVYINDNPSVSAGEDKSIVLPTNSVSLTGTVSDTYANSPMSVQWTRVSGPNSPTIVSSTSLSTNITGLIAGTYVFRLTATDSFGLTGSDDASVIVGVGSTVPTITTTAVSSITQTSAVSGGNITSDGGSVVTARGIVWNTSSNPTIALSTKTTNGSGTGSFSSNIINLSQNTTYYVRAYATNSNGTAYGADQVFTTPATNKIPNVNAGPDLYTYKAKGLVGVSGASSLDDDGSISSNNWTFISGPKNPIISNGTTLSPTFSEMTLAGTYVFRLTATDNLGATGYDDMSVVVQEDSPYGTLSVSGCTIALNSNTCNSSVTWTTFNLLPGGSTAVTRDNPANTIVSNATSGTNFSHTVNYGQTRFYLYHVGDRIYPFDVIINVDCALNSNWSASDNKCIASANSAPNTPTITGPSNVFKNSPEIFNITATDPNNDQLIYGVDWDGNGTEDNWSASYANSGSVVQMNHSWPANGTYNVRVFAQDINGARSPWSVALPVTVTDAPVAPSITSFITSKNIIEFGETVNLSWTSSNATSCTMSSTPAPSVSIASLSNTINNNINFNPTKTTIYALQCFGPGGSSPEVQKTVNVGKIKPKINEF